MILGTPTYAVPPWLQKKHPDIAAQYATGVRRPWGGRQEVDYSHPEFRPYAERVVRAIVARYVDHPAIIGYQVDNEPGLELFHNKGSFDRFLDRLRAKYGDVETLNREWGLTYWSHRLNSYEELWAPDGNWQPQYDLAWRRHQAELTTEFIAWQAGIVREYARDDQFVTTCIAYTRPAVDDEAVTLALDVTAANPYYGMQDHLDATLDIPPFQTWATTGVWGLMLQADRAFSSKQGRFLVTETNAQAISGPSYNLPPYPGQLVQAALALVSRGAAMIEYWQWHTLHYGTETYWGGVLPHSQQPGRVYREVTELGRRLARLGPVLEGYEPDAEVAILWSTNTRFAFECQPPLADETGTPDGLSYRQIFEASYRGILDAGAQARVLHVGQAVQLGGAELAHSFPVLVAPAVYVATDAQLQLLADYAEAGGHLIVGIRTGYGDEEAARPVRHRSRRAEQAGRRLVRGVQQPRRAARTRRGGATDAHPGGTRHALGRRTSRRRRRRARTLPAPGIRSVRRDHNAEARRRTHHRRRYGTQPRPGRRADALGGARANCGRVEHRRLTGARLVRPSDRRRARVVRAQLVGQRRHGDGPGSADRSRLGCRTRCGLDDLPRTMVVSNGDREVTTPS